MLCDLSDEVRDEVRDALLARCKRLRATARRIESEFKTTIGSITVREVLRESRQQLAELRTAREVQP